MVAHHMKEELKYATTGGGVQYVMIFGMEMMLQLPVDNWDFHHGVIKNHLVCKLLHLF